jgi:hypothetical protein
VKKAAFIAFQVGLPIVFVVVGLTGWGVRHPLPTTIAIFVAFVSWIVLMDNERFKGWARAEGGWIAHWFG